MVDETLAVAPEGGDTPVQAVEPAEVIDADVSPEPEKAEATPQVEGHEEEPSPSGDPDAEKELAPLMTRKEQDRWDRLTRERGTAERNSEAWRDQVQNLQARLQALEKAPEPPAAPEKPKTLADFGYDETQYAAHLTGIAEVNSRAAARQEYQKYEREQDNKAVRLKYDDRASTFAKKHADYQQVATNSPISDQVAAVVMRLDEGPEVAYFLGLNPEVASEISRMPLPMAAVELGRIDNRLAAERKRTKPVSKAPPPPNKVDGGTPHVGKKLNDPSLTDKEFAAVRRKQIKRRSGSSVTT